MLDIKPIAKSTRFCLDDVYATVVNWLRQEYELIFFYSWNFGYDMGSSNLFGHRITLGRGGDWRIDAKEFLLEKIYGIKVSWHTSDSYNQIIRVIDSEIKIQFPVGISLNSYWCPWSQSYKKYETNHTCLVIGIDTEKEGFFCVDRYLSEEIEFLPFDDFKNGFKVYATFSLSDSQAKQLDWKFFLNDSVCRTLKGYKGISDFEVMRIFADDFENFFDIKEELKGFSDVWAVPLYLRFDGIAQSRVCFVELLRNLKRKYNILELSKSLEMLETSVQKWEITRRLLLKMLIANDSSAIKFKIADYIKEIAEIEENAATEIKNNLEDNVKKVI